MRSGWFREGYRHSLAARGIRTSFRKKYVSFGWGGPYTAEDTSKKSTEPQVPEQPDRTPVMHTDRRQYLRYEPQEMDKVVFVDLDDTIADVETESDLKDVLGFDLIESMGIEGFRKAGREGRLINVDNYEARIAAYERWKAGKVPSFDLGDFRGKFYVFERPGMVDKLKELSKQNRLVLYTAAGPLYAKQVLKSLGADDLFQDMISNEQLELFRMVDSELPYKEGLKPISPAARSLGLKKEDVILLDDREDFAGGPEARAQWVRSPGATFPTPTTMDDFFKQIDKKVKQLKEGKFIDEHPKLISPTAHLGEDTREYLHNKKVWKELSEQNPPNFITLNPKNPAYGKKKEFVVDDSDNYVSGPWDYEDEATKEYYRNLFSKGGNVE